MKTVLKSLMLIIISASFTLCSKSPSEPEKTGTLRLHLTDAPARFEAVNIHFSEISAHIDSNWITVVGDPVTVNLLEWSNGNTLILGTTEVPAGHYTQIRIKIDSADVTVDGLNHPVTVPSGAQTGLKLIASFEVPPGSTFELVLDFDASRSVITTGPPGNPTGYLLKPTIRVTPLAITGSASGVVSNPENSPFAFAIADGDTITSSIVDTTTGEFMLAFLPPDSYLVSIIDDVGRSFEQNTEVVAGSDKHLGSITLQ